MKNDTIRYIVLTTEQGKTPDTQDRIIVDAEIKTAPRENFYKTIQSEVGGVFDVATAPDGSSIYCHDEGLLIGLPMNPFAGSLWNYGLAGTLVVTGPVDGAGYDTDVDESIYADAIGLLIDAGLVKN